ncbi:tetratricopeptide repeat protein [Bradyrhizobium sp. HKCCYLRH1030]|uniref:tetratricopeptide repeat protein n=1 Tax=Bradyrhizobium sp. HKCCYLRH1030 TaxID=3420744 RepID=UPI003EBAD113
MAKSETHTSAVKGSVAKQRLEAHRTAIETAERLLKEADAERAPEQREYLTGLALYQLQEYELAQKHLLASFNMRESPETAGRLAVSYWRANDLDTAESWIKRAISLDPKGSIHTQIADTKPSYLAILSQILLSAGQADSAADSAEAALSLNPGDVAALSVTASTRLARGDGKGALEALDAALKHAPNFIGEHMKREQGVARDLLAANVNLRPFAADLSAINRLVI